MENLQQVDWIGMEKFMKKQSPISRCNIIQMIHDWQNMGSQKEKFFYSDNTNKQLTQSDLDKGERLGKCPLGCRQKEVPFHFMKCMSDIMADTRNKGLIDLEKGLSKIKTAPSLIEAIIQGICCWTDDVEYDLDEESHELLFSESHSRLLKVQSDIGWEYFVKGYIAKDWGHIQLSFYKSIRTNPLKFNRLRWVDTLLRLLHIYRTSLWHMRNFSLHGGYTATSRKALRQQIIREVQVLYKKDRTLLPLVDRKMFNLPLQYRVRQGNQHLLLWIKRAQLAYDSIVETQISSVVQTSIVDWLNHWKPDIPSEQDDLSDIITWDSTEVERDKVQGQIFTSALTQTKKGTIKPSGTFDATRGTE
jgi:hypothetical protein